MRKVPALFIMILLLLAVPWNGAAQEMDDLFGEEEPGDDLIISDPGEEPTDISDILADPFATPDNDAGEEKDSATGESNNGDDESFFSDLDDLFSGDDELIEEAEVDGDKNPEEIFLVNEILEWGGSFSGSLNFDWTYHYLNTFNIFDPSSEALDPSVGAKLFFDARPTKGFRVFSKFEIGGSGSSTSSLLGSAGGSFLQDTLYFAIITDDDGNITFDPLTADEYDPENGNHISVDSEQLTALNSAGGVTSNNNGIPFSVYELFVDFNYEEELFLRFGKYNIKWGVGYFWSPADILNLSSIDIENPTADREGPVSLKVQIPFDTNNFYFYLVTPEDSEPADIAIAPKIEFLLGNTEVGIAGYYQRDLAPRVMGMVTTSVWEFDLFGEMIMSFGSDKTFVRKYPDQSAANEDPDDNFDIVLETYQVPPDSWVPFVSGTIGLSYLRSDPNISIFGQYFYNAEGYFDSDLLSSAYYLQQNPDTNGLTISDTAAQPEGYEDPPALSAGDLTNFGRHYIALAFNWSSIADTDLSMNIFGLMNVNDISGIASLNLSYRAFDKFTVTAGTRITFGEPGDEFTNPAALIGTAAGISSENLKDGPTISFTLGISLGSGRF